MAKRAFQAQEEAGASRLAQQAFTLGKGSLVSRLLGFAREILFASILGVGGVADAFLLAFRIPNIFRRLMAEGALGYAFIPAYRRLQGHHGPDHRINPGVAHSTDRADAFARSVFVRVCLFFIFAALLGMLFSRHLVLLMAPGLTERPGVLGDAAFFLTLCLPYVPLAVGAALIAATLMARGYFSAPAAAPAIMNVVLVTGGLIVLALGAWPNTGGQGEWFRPENACTVLCAAMLLGGVAQLAWLVRAGRKAGFRLVGPVSMRDCEAGAVIAACPTGALGASAQQVMMLAAVFLASFMPEGSIAALYFAERFLETPLGLVGSSLGLAALTNLAGIASQAGEDRDSGRAAFRESLGMAAHFALYLSIPAAVALIVLGRALVALFFGYGAFDARALEETSSALTALAVGLPAMTLAKPLTAALNALGAGRNAALATLAGACVTLALGAGLLLIGGESAVSPLTPALALSVASWLLLPLLFFLLARRAVCPVPSTRSLAATMGGSVALFAFLWALESLSLPLPLYVICATVTGCALYLGTTFLCGSREAALCRELVRRRREKG